MGKEEMVDSVTEMLVEDLIEVNRDIYVQNILPQL